MVPVRRRRRLRFRPEALTFVLLGAAALGTALVLARGIRYGAALAYDSIAYIAVARHLLEGNGFLTFDWGYYALGPPFYPVLLAVAGLGLFDPIEVAGALNAAVLGLTVFVAGDYLRRRVTSRLLVVWAAVTLAVAVPLVDLASWALSGSVFVLLTTLALVNLADFLTEGRRRSLAGAIVFSALAWQTRYLGVGLVAAVGLLLLSSRGSWVERGKRVAALSLAAGLPMAAWMVRNTLSIGLATGKREWPRTSLPETVTEIGSILGGWFETDLLPGTGAGVEAALLLAAVAAAVFVRSRAGRRARPAVPAGGAPARAAEGSGAAPVRRNREDLRVFLVFALVYTAALAAGMMLGQTGHGVAPRFVAPLYVPLLLAAILALDRRFCTRRGGPAAPGRVRDARLRNRFGVAAAALALWTIGQTPLQVRAIGAANTSEPTLYRGFAAPPWTDSETIRALRGRETVGPVFTNLPILLYLHFDNSRFIRYLPEALTDDGRPGPESPAPGETGPFRQWLEGAAEGTWIAWFEGVDRANYEYGLAELRSRPTLEPMADLDDGALFRVNRSYRPPANPYRAAYRAMRGGAWGDPVARAPFDLYFDGTNLGYLRVPCTATDTEPRFFLHIYPVDTGDLPPERTLFKFENRDFAFPDYGVILDEAPPAPDANAPDTNAADANAPGTTDPEATDPDATDPDATDPNPDAAAPEPPAPKCVALVRAPGYPISYIRTGQYLSGQPAFWNSRFDLQADDEAPE